jgi:uncharacterized protein (UPF0548 family)
MSQAKLCVADLVLACLLVSCSLDRSLALPSIDSSNDSFPMRVALPGSRKAGLDDINGHDDQSRGTTITWRQPSTMMIKQWFGGGGRNRHTQEFTSSTVRGEYNHDSVGMTEPVETLAGPAKDEKYKNAGEITNTPWPTTAILPHASWRRIRLYTSVGRGVPCYQRCREAALAWEFQGKSKGMIAVPQRDGDPTNHRDGSFKAREVGGSSDASRRRRFITYSKIRLPFSRSSLYVMSPVAVVYDVVDGKTTGGVYTATAYGTMRGHWLRGEERVCVRYCHASGAVEMEIISFSKPARSVMGYLVWPLIGKMQRTFFEQQMQELKVKSAPQRSPMDGKK